jgi:hypothetical protein
MNPVWPKYRTDRSKKETKDERGRKERGMKRKEPGK